jgi:hypothetical protein
MNIKKRTEGKIKNTLGLRDCYKYYKENNDDPVDYKTFTNCIKECNKELIDTIVNQSDKVQLPYRLGELNICKFKRSYNTSTSRWAVDFKRTKEEGFKVFFNQTFIYKWKWWKDYTIVKNKSKYKFTASRLSKRLIPVALKNNIEYF